MKIIFALVIIITLLMPLTSNSSLIESKIKNKTTKEEKQTEKKKKIIFRIRKSQLWFKHDELKDKKDNDIIEVSLNGELYRVSVPVKEVTRKDIDLSTPEGLVASYFSASKEGDINWILENFVNEEKDKIQSLFSDRKTLKESKKGAKSIKQELITGKVEYKDYVILFIEQESETRQKVTEAVACKKTKDGWRLTNELSQDKTFDIVFAALSNGRVFEEGGIETKIRKPEVRIIR